MNPASPPVPTVTDAQPWFHVWRAAVLSPRTSTFTDIAARKGATSRRALLWMFTASLISVLPLASLALVHSLSQAPTTRMADALADGFGNPLILLLVPIAFGLASALSLALWAAIGQSTARLLGGAGHYQALLYSLGAFAAPLTLLGTVLSTATPIQGLATIIFVYQLILAGIATKAIHRLNWLRAIIPTALASALVFLVVPFCLQAILFLILFRPAP